MSQPISDAVRTAIESETPVSTAAGYSVAGYLADLFDTAGSFNYATPLRDRYARDAETTTGLTWGLKWGLYQTMDGSVQGHNSTTKTLTNNATNYVFIDSAGDITVNTTGFVVPCIPLWVVVTVGGAVSSYTDMRSRMLLLYGQTVTAAMLSAEAAAHALTASMTVGAKVGDAIIVSGSILDLAGNVIGGGAEVAEFWLSDTSGGWETGTAADTLFDVATGIAGCGTKLATLTAGKRMLVKQSTLGTFQVKVRHSGSHTWYLVALVQGKVYVSGPLAF